MCQARDLVGNLFNKNKSEYTCFKQERAISNVRYRPLKLVDKLGNILSAESDVNIRLAKAWVAINRLSIIRSQENMWCRRDLMMMKCFQALIDNTNNSI